MFTLTFVVFDNVQPFVLVLTLEYLVVAITVYYCKESSVIGLERLSRTKMHYHFVSPYITHTVWTLARIRCNGNLTLVFASILGRLKQPFTIDFKEATCRL